MSFQKLTSFGLMLVFCFFSISLGYSSDCSDVFKEKQERLQEAKAVLSGQWNIQLAVQSLVLEKIDTLINTVKIYSLSNQEQVLIAKALEKFYWQSAVSFSVHHSSYIKGKLESLLKKQTEEGTRDAYQTFWSHLPDLLKQSLGIF